MLNNKLGQIKLGAVKLPQSSFNLSSDTSTTFGFGEIQPLMCQHMLAGSDLTVQTESLIRLAPINVPTMGRLKAKIYHMFIESAEIFPAFDNMIANTSYSYNGVTYRPRAVPHLPLGLLSTLIFIGAKMQVYERVNEASTGAGLDLYSLPSSASGDGSISGILQFIHNAAALTGSIDFTSNLHDGRYVEGLESCGIKWRHLLSDNIYDYYHPGPNTAIPDWMNYFVPLGYTTGTTAANSVGRTTLTDDTVDIRHCDYVIEHQYTYNGTTRYFAFAFNLSGFGKRIRKMLIGSGYQINFDSRKSVSLMHLFATWKSYFSLFGLEQWINYETTYLNLFISSVLNSAYSFGQFENGTDPMKWFCRFIGDVGSCWYTQQQDYVSAHIANIANITHDLSTYKNIIDVSNTTMGIGKVGDVVDYGGTILDQSSANNNPHGYINRLLHSQIDSGVLKKLYRFVNHDSVIGQRIGELLRARGFKDYVDECKGDFIGKQEFYLKISDVVSMTDSYREATSTTGSSGALLGDRGATGIGHDDSKPFKYHAKKDGYWVALAVIVPDSGYAQSLDPAIYQVDRDTYYQPDYDGLGMEASPKLNVIAAQRWSENYERLNNDGTLDETFGFIPFYSGLKIGHNKLNGDFNLESTRNTYSAFTLDKLMYINDKHDEGVETINTRVTCKLRKDDFTPRHLPVAGQTWRYTTRYGFLNNFHRMFAMIGENDKNPKLYAGDVVFNEVCLPYFDNFLGQFIFNVQYRAAMRPIEDSFETKEDGNEGPTNMAVSKA